MKKIEAELIQQCKQVIAFLFSSKHHAEQRISELNAILEKTDGKETRLKLGELLAKAEYWLDVLDEEFAWVIDVNERTGIARWFLRNRGSAQDKENALRLSQEMKKRLKEIRIKCALCMAGIVFRIEEDAIKLMISPEVYEEEEERRKMLEEIEEFSKRIEEEVKKKLKKKKLEVEDEIKI